MTFLKALDSLVHHHTKSQRSSIDTETSSTPPMESTTPVEQLPTHPAEVHHHNFLHKLVHPSEKEDQGEAHHNKPHHQRHKDPVYLHHAVSASDLAALARQQASTRAPEEAHTATPPHHTSTPLGNGWEKVKHIAHDHHEAANDSFVAYYSAMTDRVPPTAPKPKPVVSSIALEEYRAPEARPHETMEHAIARLGAIEHKRHHKEHTMGYGVAAV